MSKHILIVDDDPAVLNSVEEYLNLSGFTTHAASNAREALSILRSVPVDLMIADIIMEEMNGMELCELVKKNYNTAVILMTGFIGDYSYEEAISRGADDFVLKPIKLEELLLRVKRVLRERALSLERAHLIEELKRLSLTDDLTKLYNVRHFFDQLRSEVSRCQRFDRDLSLLLIDIDLFKEINDNYGHLTGNKILAELATRITKNLRNMDTAYRFGGDEFTVLLPETDKKSALNVAGRISDSISSSPFPVPMECRITVSIGVTDYRNGDTPESLVKRADAAMYKSKKNGRNMINAL